MLGAHVCPYAVALPCGEGAVLARQWPLACVQSPVHCQVALASETAAAVTADKVADLVVHTALVQSQLVLVHKALVALAAHLALATRMVAAQMCQQGVAVVEASVTRSDGAPLLGMQHAPVIRK